MSPVLTWRRIGRGTWAAPSGVRSVSDPPGEGPSRARHAACADGSAAKDATSTAMSENMTPVSSMRVCADATDSMADRARQYSASAAVSTAATSNVRTVALRSTAPRHTQPRQRTAQRN